ncbi:MAG TPA: hypothetical protein VM432_05450 [Bdellovibrionales bacterium]|nr:hypothetical protein [Bdellovibrionales bacterium]
MKAIFTIVLGVLVSASANAALTGNWVGSGEYRDGSGYKEPCKKMTLTMKHTATSITANYRFQCDSFTIYTPEPLVGVIKSGKIMVGKQQIGTITGNAMNVKVKSNTGETVTYTAKIAANGKLSFLQGYVGKDASFKIAGVFSKKK